MSAFTHQSSSLSLDGSESEGPENIWIACGDGDVSRVLEILQADPSMVNQADEFGYTPLHAAVSYGHAELIELLLGGGAHVNKGDEDGDTPLHYCEAPSVAELLILAGADIAAVNNYNETVLDKAIENEHEEMVVFWESRGVIRNVTAEDMERRLRGIREGDEEEEEDEDEDMDEEGAFDGDEDDGEAPEGFDEEAVRSAIMQQVMGASMQTDEGAEDNNEQNA